MSLLPKLPPYMRKKSPPGGFFGKPVPPNSPYHLTMSIPIFSTPIGNSNTSPTLTNGNSSTSPVSPLAYVNLPRGLVPMEHQVAGHTFQLNNPNELGLLKRSDGFVLKPAGKASCGEREIKFYESLNQTQVPEHLSTLRDLVPVYHGSEVLAIDGREVTFIKLEDLTDKMLEPCVMDVKIGRRTWDPLATPEKREAEEGKYVECKQGLGFCVPGFQVHSVRTGAGEAVRQGVRQEVERTDDQGDFPDLPERREWLVTAPAHAVLVGPVGDPGLGAHTDQM